MSHRLVKEVVGIRYSDFPKLKTVIEEIKQMLHSNRDIVSDMSRDVYFIAFGTYSHDIEITAYTYETKKEGFKRIREQIFFAIGDILEKHQVELAFPTTCIEFPQGMTMTPQNRPVNPSDKRAHAH